MKDNSEGKVFGYHLLVRPRGLLLKELEETVKVLAEEYDGPLFEPHVTLLSSMPFEDETLLIEKTAALAEESKALQLTFGEIGMQDAYFRTLFLRVELSEDLAKLRARAEQVFDMENTDAFMPHLSLLYGNYPQTKKVATAALITAYKGVSFDVDSILLYKTDGEPTTWRTIQEFKLPS
ncbi:MAG: 2'-5' RNA ligase family protein [Patescibacteria group bacterium]